MRKHCCDKCGEDSLTDLLGTHYCRECYIETFGFGQVEVQFEPAWMAMCRTSTEIVQRDYFVAPSLSRSNLNQGTCLCGPNREDPDRDCPVHRPEDITFGLDTNELRRGGLD
jgi:hypothetical protein